jgi:hypothetical protein
VAGCCHAADVEFEFECWNCEADCVIWGEPYGWWVDKYRLDAEWACWHCGATNITPDD